MIYRGSGKANLRVVDGVHADDPVPDDGRLYSRLWRKISAGTIVDEFTTEQWAFIAGWFSQFEYRFVQPILDAHGGDFQPARV